MTSSRTLHLAAELAPGAGDRPGPLSAAAGTAPART
ncbi:FMNH2-dependent monooxygenase, partial [Streptomyces sp. adm13(2018)]